MVEPTPLDYQSAPPLASSRFYYGWVNLIVAALAMVATLPGRTLGLALVTEPLLRDLSLDRVQYATINLWATLIGATFAVLCGPLIDRFGTRVVVSGVCGLLGATVVAMSRVHGATGLLVTATLTRGLGQSALSVVSIAIVGKWFVRRINLAMAVYAVLLSIGFMIAFPAVQYAAERAGWRPAWQGVAIGVLAVAVLGWALVRSTPESIGLAADAPARKAEPTTPTGWPLRRVLLTPAFWVFALSCAMFNLVYSGIGLFNEDVLRELGFDSATFRLLLAVMTMVGLLANFLGGWLGERWPINRLMAVAMLMMTAGLLLLPRARSGSHALAYGALMGVTGGIVTVVFFACWPRMFGRAHLGKIQGVAQAMTVLASALGPVLVAESKRLTNSYLPLLYWLAPAVGALGVCAWLIHVPSAGQADVAEEGGDSAQPPSPV